MTSAVSSSRVMKPSPFWSRRPERYLCPPPRRPPPRVPRRRLARRWCAVRPDGCTGGSRGRLACAVHLPQPASTLPARRSPTASPQVAGDFGPAEAPPDRAGHPALVGLTGPTGRAALRRGCPGRVPASRPQRPANLPFRLRRLSPAGSPPLKRAAPPVAPRPAAPFSSGRVTPYRRHLLSVVDDRPATFESLGVPAHLCTALAERGFTAPLPIQARTLPDAFAGRDVSGCAPTGSGKTIAFGLPLVLNVGRAGPRRPRGLVLAPTRELAAQITEELRLLGQGRVSAEAFYGGVGFEKQRRALARGVDIVVACPGRLADLLRQRELELSEVRIVVIDEADRMADMGFLPEVKRLLDRCRADRQTLLFSATLDGDVDVLVRRYQKDPVRHDFRPPQEDLGDVEHLFWTVELADRVRAVGELVGRAGPTIVFCRTKRGADRVARQLSQAGVQAVAIHGGRSQSQRDRALADFRRGAADAIVATDVAARGIHVDGVACVVHFDPPDEPKDYVHRSGRTGRAGATGTVVTLVTREARRDVLDTQRRLGRRVSFEAPRPEDLPEAPKRAIVAAPAPRPTAPGESRGRGDGRPRSTRGGPSRRSRGGRNQGGRGQGGPSGRPGGHQQHSRRAAPARQD
ncbi:MAG: DEAD/DEAH box helicase [Acidimicrobiia bacterium]|nr:DEAD/DEAH box helicase [Acidimicrobiia bacterium]